MISTVSYDLQHFNDKERRLFKKSMLSKKWIPSNVETTYSKEILANNMKYEQVRRAVAVSQVKMEIKGAFDFALDYSNRVRRLPSTVNFHAQVG